LPPAARRRAELDGFDRQVLLQHRRSSVLMILGVRGGAADHDVESGGKLAGG